MIAASFHSEQEVLMQLGKDVLRLIFLCEKIQIASLDGTLSPDEAIFIRQCAAEMLKTVVAPEPAATLDK
jgi:hypothetical protein